MATDCVPSVKEVDVYFKGKVTAIESSGFPEYIENGSRLPDKKVTYQVLETGFKLPKEVPVYYYSHSPFFALPAATGEVRWVYGNVNHYGEKKYLQDSSCGFTLAPGEIGK